MAQIISVYDPTTGAAVALDALPALFAIQAIVVRGPSQPPPTGASRLELYFDGSRDTTLVLPLDAPVPSVVAHSFEVRGLAPGRYSVGVQLVDALGIAVRSTPVRAVVRPLP